MTVMTLHRLMKKIVLFWLLCIMPLAAADTFLSDKHIQLGFTCAQCHLENPPNRDVETQQCETCHGDYEKLAILTEKTLPHNPHNSHLGEPECSECHKGHQASVLACNECHTYDMPVP